MKTILAVLVLACAGCAIAPLRILQKKVPAALSEKPAAQVEGERRGAAFIRGVTAPPVADPAAAVVQVHEVAAALVSSLGEPEKPVSLDEKDAIIAGLRAGLVAKETQLAAWKAFGRKYAGQPIEGTGINLAGPAGLVGLALVVAACVAFPPLGYLLLRVLPLIWGAFRRTAVGVEKFSREHPAAGPMLTATLSRKMDTAHKSLVKQMRGHGLLNEEA